MSAVEMKEEEIRKRDVFNKYLKILEEDIPRYFNDQSQFVKVDCPACGDSEHRHEFTKAGFPYATCKKCDTLFVNPRPTIKDLDRFYTESKSTSFFVNDFLKPVVEARREKIFKPRVEYVVERFRNHSFQTIADIGAGFGIFLEELAKVWRNKQLVAIEPSTEMANICKEKGCEVIAQMVENIDGHSNRFDLITSFELFEHLYNPKQFLEKIHNLLKPGGYFLMTTLSGGGFDIRLLWEKSKSVSPPHHLNFFNPKSSQILFEQCGFEIEEISTPGKLDWDIVEGMILKEGVSTDKLWDYFAREATKEAKQKLQAWISENNMSSHMRVLCRKK